MSSPAPYARIGRQSIYHGDSRAILHRLGFRGAIVTDPPYGIAYCHPGTGAGLHTRRNSRAIIGDQVTFEPSWLLGYPDLLLWGANHYSLLLPPGGTWLAWDKSIGRGPADHFVDAEFAWCSLAGLKRNIARVLWKGIACAKDGENNGRRWHPTQKPIALMKWCIDFFPGAPICDPYMGVGSTLVAAQRLGRRAIGIEVDRRYCRIAAQRLEAEAARGAL